MRCSEKTTNKVRSKGEVAWKLLHGKQDEDNIGDMQQTFKC